MGPYKYRVLGVEFFSVIVMNFCLTWNKKENMINAEKNNLKINYLMSQKNQVLNNKMIKSTFDATEICTKDFVLPSRNH